jgi:uncharacterized membrane protein YbhN (UPF0104 family)
LPRSLAPAFATEAGAQDISFSITRRLAGVGVVGAVVVGAVAFRGSAVEAVASLQDLRPLPLALGGAGMLLALAASAGAWRSALRSAGADIRCSDAWGCYGIGSLANAVLPARLGEAVRIGLFASRVDDDDRHWLSAGACGAVATARAVVYALTCSAAAAAGILPLWTLVAPAVGIGLAALVASMSPRRLRRFRLSGMLTPSRGSALLAWSALSAAARLAAAMCVFSALGIDAPIRSALIGLTALAVAGALPIAPGGLGVAGAGMALALQQSGIPGATAVAAALAFHAVETVATLAFGSSGWAVLRLASGAGSRTCSRPRSASG